MARMLQAVEREPRRADPVASIMDDVFRFARGPDVVEQNNNGAGGDRRNRSRSGSRNRQGAGGGE